MLRGQAHQPGSTRCVARPGHRVCRLQHVALPRVPPRLIRALWRSSPARRTPPTRGYGVAGPRTIRQVSAAPRLQRGPYQMHRRAPRPVARHPPPRARRPSGGRRHPAKSTPSRPHICSESPLQTQSLSAIMHARQPGIVAASLAPVTSPNRGGFSIMTQNCQSPKSAVESRRTSARWRRGSAWATGHYPRIEFLAGLTTFFTMAISFRESRYYEGHRHGPDALTIGTILAARSRRW